MTERERLLEEMTAAIEEAFWDEIDHVHLLTTWQAKRAAAAALSVVERPASDSGQEIKICTCSNTGYTIRHEEGCALA